MSGTDPPRCRSPPHTVGQRRRLSQRSGRTFLDALPQQALNADENQCAPANPRMPMLDDMRKIMRTAYCWCARGRPDTDKGRTALA